VRIADRRIEDRRYDEYVKASKAGFPRPTELMTAAEFRDYRDRQPDSSARQRDLSRRRKEAEVRWRREELS